MRKEKSKTQPSPLKNASICLKHLFALTSSLNASEKS